MAMEATAGGGFLDVVLFIESLRPNDRECYMCGMTGAIIFGYRAIVDHLIDSKGFKFYDWNRCVRASISGGNRNIEMMKYIISIAEHSGCVIDWIDCLKYSAECGYLDVLLFIETKVERLELKDWCDVLKLAVRHYFCLDMVKYAVSKGANNWDEAMRVNDIMDAVFKDTERDVSVYLKSCAKATADKLQTYTHSPA